jgi:hypothetical protein
MWDSLINWVDANHQWVFSGVGVAVVGAVWNFFRRKSTNARTTSLKSGRNSTNLNAGGNITLNVPAAPGHEESSDQRQATQHDQQLFRRYDETLGEEELRNRIDNEIFNHRTDTDFCHKMDTHLALMHRTEGRFLDPELQTKLEEYGRALGKLNIFIAINFFEPNGLRTNSDDSNTRLRLYPDLKNSSKSEDRESYKRYSVELTELLDPLISSYENFRTAIKTRLYL